MFGKLGGNEALGVPPLSKNPSLFGGERGGHIYPGQQRQELQEVSRASANMGLLAPALVGAAAFFLLTQLFRVEGTEENSTSVAGSLGSIIYTGIATAGVSYYIYNLLLSAGSRPLYAFIPFSWAIWVQILYYAAVYNWVQRLYPGSFSEDFGESPFDQIVTAIYFSISTFSTGDGQILFPLRTRLKFL